MKRSDIKVGDVLYHTTTPDFENAKYRAKSARVVVLDVDHKWENRSYRYSGDLPSWDTSVTSNGVLAEVTWVGYNGDERAHDNPFVMAVQPAALKGDFETVTARLREHSAKHHALETERTAKRQDARELSECVAAELKSKGLEVTTDFHGNVSLSAHEAQRLLEMLNADVR